MRKLTKHKATHLSLANSLSNSWYKTLNLIFPISCRFCNKIITDNNYICKECYKNISFLPNALNVYFSKYNNNLPELNYHIHDSYFLLPENPSIIYIKIYSAVLYDEITRKIVTQFKYNGHIFLSKLIESLISKVHSNLFKKYDLLIAVPLHPLKFLNRGFNQSAEIARLLSKQHEINFRADLIKRIKYTKPATELSRSDRFINLSQAFEVVAKYRSFIQNKKILLFDDVYTTGATTKSIVLELLKYHPNVVDVLTFARTPLT
ncbi:ComF family protein [Bartonella sp. DGB1]|uniref:ComF family protein n=1 Tax=Bartonella sp. DGB1 TaxID=3239807 RepID=UPI003523F07F